MEKRVIREYCLKNALSPDEKKQAQKIGEKLKAKIEKAVSDYISHQAEISFDRFIGIFIGDGHLGAYIYFPNLKNGSVGFQAKFEFQIVDCKANEPLLVLIQNFLLKNGISSKIYQQKKKQRFVYVFWLSMILTN